MLDRPVAGAAGSRPATLGDDPTPEALKAARLACGLSRVEFGLALGYRGISRNTVGQQVYEMETGRKGIRPAVFRLAQMFQMFGIPAEFRNRTGKEAIE